MENKIEPEYLRDIKRLLTTDDAEIAQKYLRDGWELISVTKKRYPDTEDIYENFLLGHVDPNA